MYFVMSPTKNMKESSLVIEKSLPVFIEKSEVLIQKLKLLEIDEIQKSMKVNTNIAKLNYDRYHSFKFDVNGEACIDTYSGLVFKQLRVEAYNQEQLAFMNQNIRILSGLYGVLKPFDSIYPYRLEMNYKPFQLVPYWQESITDYFKDEIVIDVASNEYGCLLSDSNCYHVHFRMEKNGKFIMQSTQVKMARGKFIDYIILNKVDNLEAIKNFNEDNYCFNEELSNANLFVFVKGE